MCMGKIRNVYEIFIGKSEGGDHLRDPGMCGRIILKFIGLDYSGSCEDSIASSRVHKKVENLFIGLANVGFSTCSLLHGVNLIRLL